jgi:hypothetical protein
VELRTSKQLGRCLLKKGKGMDRITITLTTAGLVLLSHIALAQSNLDPLTSDQEDKADLFSTRQRSSRQMMH